MTHQDGPLRRVVLLRSVASADRPVRADRDSVLDESLADQELEASPRRRDSPRTSGRPATRSASSRRRGVRPASRRTSAGGRATVRADSPGRSRARAAPPPPARRSRLAQRRRQRPERVPVERRRRHRPATLLDVLARSASARARLRAGAAARELLARGEPARHQPRRPLRRVPGAEVLDHRLRVHLRLRVGRELLHRRRAAEALRGGPQLLEDLLVRVTPPDPRLELGERLPDRSPSLRDKASAPPPRMVERIRECASAADR